MQQIHSPPQEILTERLGFPALPEEPVGEDLLHTPSGGLQRYGRLLLAEAAHGIE